MRNPFARSSDDSSVIRNRHARRLDDRTVEGLLSGRAIEGEEALSAFVAEARALVPESAPAPNDALAAMLEGGVTPTAAPLAVPVRPSRRRLQAAVAVGTALGLVVTAGAANALPGPVQNGVSDVVGWVSPFDVPRADHADDHGPAPLPSPSRTREPEPGDDRGSSTPEPGDDHGSAGPEPGDDKGSPGSGSSDDGTSSGSGSSGSGSDDGTTSSGSGSGSSSGSDDGSTSSGSGSGGSGSSGSDDQSVASPTPSPTKSDSGRSSPTPTPTSDHGGSSDG